VNVYPPHSNGDVKPLASFTKGMNGPFTVVFDPSGDLWAANVNNNATLIEFRRAQLATPDPAPAVTIWSNSKALNFPSGMVFDSSGDLWVVADNSSLPRVYEYAKSQLTRSGSPKPVAAISNFHGGIPGGDIFDPRGDLWVTVQLFKGCPHGCVMEYPRAELSTPDPAPSVVISSTGGANMDFTSSGDLWMVTGGGPPPAATNCFGSPCNNELVEFTKAQLATSGSPSPAVTIRSTLPRCSVSTAPSSTCSAGSLYGPYGVAIDSAGVWVSNYNKPTTVEYSSHQLSHSGSPAPVRTIAGPGTGMNWPSFVVLAP
jgi:hypothetical protein